MNEQDHNITIIEHINGFAMINTWLLELGIDAFVLSNQCEKSFYSKVPSKASWSHVIGYHQRGIPIKYTLSKKDEIKEDQQDDVEKVCVN